MGVDFCGYRIFHTHKLVRKRSKERMKKRIKKWNVMYKNNNINYKYVTQSFKSWKAHISHANSFNLYNSYVNKLEFELE